MLLSCGFRRSVRARQAGYDSTSPSMRGRHRSFALVYHDFLGVVLSFAGSSTRELRAVVRSSQVHMSRSESNTRCHALSITGIRKPDRPSQFRLRPDIGAGTVSRGRSTTRYSALLLDAWVDAYQKGPDFKAQNGTSGHKSCLSSRIRVTKMELT